MMSLTVQQPHAAHIADGHKTIEYRTWATDYRGPLLITASAKPAGIAAELDNGRTVVLPVGCMVCVVDLADITGAPGDYYWHIANPRSVKPVKIKGKLRLWESGNQEIEYLPTGMDWLDYQS